ncbi:SDR family oxidoreductase [Azospirillum canadense]|uniref:SDR family oxidoreductase n=1 Tax=Azospirillum canadense TaxID=403962 RepID=UPI002225C361|nr:SDR family oxidoreductase [Azospirillum canadense]MCW2241932.1 3-oxoacyl-[acyl-carrier protein] reductase [Azospirillum canadense]
MDFGLKGKVALVLGGSQGIGRAAALGFAREGASVAICGRDAERLEAARAALDAAGVPVLAVRADVSAPGDVERLVDMVADAFGTVHILVNNAAGPKPGPFDSLTGADWEDAFRLTLMSAVNATRAVLPHMRRQRWGRIVNISSYSVKQPIGELMLSNSLRLGALGWAKTLATQVAPDGILVNTVCPGWTATDRMRQVIGVRAAGQGRSVEVAAAGIAAGIPVGRFGTPEEIADLIVFLGSERASYITGTAIPVDGGIVQSAL